jgi:hypothetical protein
VLRFVLDRPDVASVTVIGRRPVELTHPKLRQVLHADLGDYAAVADALGEQDVAFFCLGVYTSAVSDAELRRITVDCYARSIRSRAASIGTSVSRRRRWLAPWFTWAFAKVQRPGIS